MKDYPGLTGLPTIASGQMPIPNSIIGDWFTTTLALAFGDSRYALKVETGCLVDIVAPPKFDVRALFGFRVPVEVYRARPQRAERGISRHDS
jgi:hypothetical protein